MVKAIWKGEIIAESDATVVVEGNHYFPPEAVKADLLAPSETTSHCHWKGQAEYHTLKVGDHENPDAAWYYPAPKAEAKALGIAGYIAFWKGVKVA